MSSIREQIEGLRGRVVIDRDALDDELIQQPVLILNSGEVHVQAVSIADAAKAKRDRVFAQQCVEARQRISDSGGKPTEKAVEAEAESTKAYREAHQAYLDACQDRDLAEVLRDSFKARGYVLEPLCQLHNSGYFASNGSKGRQTAESRDAEAKTTLKQMADERKAKKR